MTYYVYHTFTYHGDLLSFWMEVFDAKPTYYSNKTFGGKSYLINGFFTYCYQQSCLQPALFHLALLLLLYGRW